MDRRGELLVPIGAFNGSRVANTLRHYNTAETVALSDATGGVRSTLQPDQPSFFANPENRIGAIRYGRPGSGVGLEFGGFTGQPKDYIRAQFNSPKLNLNVSEGATIVGSRGALVVLVDRGEVDGESVEARVQHWATALTIFRDRPEEFLIERWKIGSEMTEAGSLGDVLRKAAAEADRFRAMTVANPGF